MAIITHKPFETVATFPSNINDEAKLTVEHCIKALAFVLPFHQTFTFTDWATEIEKVFDNPTVSFFALILRQVDAITLGVVEVQCVIGD